MWMCTHIPCLSRALQWSEQLMLMLVSVTTKQATDMTCFQWHIETAILFFLANTLKVFCFYLILFYGHGCFTCMHDLVCAAVCAARVCHAQSPEEAVGSPGTGIILVLVTKLCPVEEPRPPCYPEPSLHSQCILLNNLQHVSWARGSVWPDTHSFLFLGTLAVVVFRSSAHKPHIYRGYSILFITILLDNEDPLIMVFK